MAPPPMAPPPPVQAAAPRPMAPSASPSIASQAMVPPMAHPTIAPSAPWLQEPADGLLFGSFQQLLGFANSGVLYPGISNASIWPHGISGMTQNGIILDASFGNPEAVTPPDAADDGYSAGTESESDTLTPRYLSERIVHDNSHHIKNFEDDDYVELLDDPIGQDEFMFGRDFDYGDFGFGIDDTAGTSTEVENSSSSDQDCCDDLPTLDADDLLRVDGIDAVNDINSFNDEEIHVSILGGRSDHAIAHEISSVYTDGVSTGFFKRQRLGANPKSTDCHKPRGMGPVEVAVHNAGQRKTTEVFEPVLGMVFDTYEAAYEFYNLYSWEAGFGIIYNHNVTRRNDKNYRTMQEFTCQKGGSSSGAKNGSKKGDCKARIKLLRTEDERWYIKDFVKDHNHPLSESCCEKREWKSHKRIDSYTLGVIKNLRQNNVDQTTVRCVIGGMFGSLKDAPTKRSLRTICNQISRNKIDDDVSKTVELFRKMKEEDPDFQWSAELGPDSTIKSLMWCSGKSVREYSCFGDVVTFDTTYCTNFYKMPFGLFVGVNNHFQTTIFAGVLMRNETTESFKWVFNEFLTLMKGVAPQTVLTDQCKAMTIALAEVWSETFHLWCKWHVFKNIREHLGPIYTKNKAFRDDLYSIANEMLTKEEFEQAWEDLCVRYKLTENQFMIRTFQCRSKWAKPWANGNFCGGMTSTQRSESANMMLKKFVPRNSSLHHFVSQYNMLLQDREMEEGRQEHQTKQLVTKHSRMWPVERHAKEIYTKATFMLFRKQVDKASSFVVSGRGKHFFVVSHHNPSQKQNWYKKSYRVYVIGRGARYSCECGLFEHLGILCCHILRLMIRFDVQSIPQAHILTRWTRNAKDVMPECLNALQIKKTTTEPLSIWQSQLNSKALEVVTKGNCDRETIAVALKYLIAASKELDDILRARSNIDVSESPEEDHLDRATDIEEISGNKYGASGSSAGLSDTEILNMKAPLVIRKAGRPRGKRFRSEADIASKKLSKRVNISHESTHIEKSPASNGTESTKTQNSTVGNTSAKPRTPHNNIQVKNSGLPLQSSFCTKCGKAGHNRTRCVSVCTVSLNKPSNASIVSCSKCGLEGHTDEECLVADADSFFK